MGFGRMGSGRTGSGRTARIFRYDFPVAPAKNRDDFDRFGFRDPIDPGFGRWLAERHF